MRLANCTSNGESFLGLVTDSGICNVGLAAERMRIDGIPRTVEEAVMEMDERIESLRNIQESLRGSPRATEFLAEAEQVKFLPPVRNPSKILCVFVNYHSHGKDLAAPSEPVFFFKHPNSLVGDGKDVLVPKFSTKPDHEVELGVVIGKAGKDIPPASAYDHIAGYTVLNDVSFRDGMSRGVEGTVLGRNLFRGKVADTALPMGPFLVSRDEIPDPYPLRISLKVNGETRQEGTTDDMIFRIPELITSASEDNTLLPGDVIATGTCSGVGLYTGKYLKDGDLMEAEVEKVGVLRNRVRTQSRA